MTYPICYPAPLISGGNFLCLYFGLCTINNYAHGQSQRSEFVTKFEWKQMEWDFPSEGEREAAIAAGTYIPGSGLPIDVDVYYGRKCKCESWVSSAYKVFVLPLIKFNQWYYLKRNFNKEY